MTNPVNSSMVRLDYLFDSAIFGMETSGVTYSKEQKRIALDYVEDKISLEMGITELLGTEDIYTQEMILKEAYMPRFENKFGIQNVHELKNYERLLVLKRLVRLGLHDEAIGVFDRKNLQDLHYICFQDLYTWAGEFRKVDINLEGRHYMLNELIDSAMGDFEYSLKLMMSQKISNKKQFAAIYAPVLNELHFIRPFLAGNLRVELQFLRRLGYYHGFYMDYSRENGSLMIDGLRDNNVFDIERGMHASIIDDAPDVLFRKKFQDSVKKIRKMNKRPTLKG